MKHTIIYIPGLGDGYDILRAKSLRFWQVFGVQTQLVPMLWYNDESYQTKLKRTSTVINTHLQNGTTVSLVGESAGGSMAINIFAQYPEITKLVLISGVNNPAAPVSSYTLKKAPAFAVSLRLLADSLQKLSHERLDNIYSLSALHDPIVSAKSSHIPGIRNKKIISVGHFLSIALCLTIYSVYIIRISRK